MRENTRGYLPDDPDNCRIHDCHRVPEWGVTWNLGGEAGFEMAWCNYHHDENVRTRPGCIGATRRLGPSAEELENQFWEEFNS